MLVANEPLNVKDVHISKAIENENDIIMGETNNNNKDKNDDNNNDVVDNF